VCGGCGFIRMAEPMTNVKIEQDHVHKVYSEIAAHFSDTRFKAWPRIAKFLGEQPAGSLVADVGEREAEKAYRAPRAGA